VVTADAIRTHGANGRDVFAGMETNARRALGTGIDVIVDACALDP
jgi:predicted kinase